MGKFAGLKQTLQHKTSESLAPYESEIDSMREPVHGAAKIRIDLLEPYPRNHRRYFNPETLSDLTASIRAQGILEALLVRSIADNRYQIVSGERRYRAARIVGLTEVPCVVREMCDREALEVSLTSNLLRDDPNPYERTKKLLELLSEKIAVSEDEVIALLKQMRSKKESARRKVSTLDNVIQGQEKAEVLDNVIQDPKELTIAATLVEVGGVSWESYLKNNIPVLSLPEEILAVLDRGDLPYNSATVISRVEDVEKRNELLQVAVAEKLSVAELRKRVKGLRERVVQAKPKTLSSRLQEIRGEYQHFEKSKAQYMERGGRAAELAIALEEKLYSFTEEYEALLRELKKIEVD